MHLVLVNKCCANHHERTHTLSHQHSCTYINEWRGIDTIGIGSIRFDTVLNFSKKNCRKNVIEVETRSSSATQRIVRHQTRMWTQTKLHWVGRAFQTRHLALQSTRQFDFVNRWKQNSPTNRCINIVLQLLLHGSLYTAYTILLSLSNF